MSDLVEKQRALWDGLAAGWRVWDANIKATRAELNALLVELARVRRDSRVLDVAAGTGEPGLTAARVASAGEVVGCDVSSSMLGVAMADANKGRLQNYRTVVYDGLVLPFAAASFDAATCSFGLEYVPEPADFLREVRRVLRPGARAVVTAWGPRRDNPYHALAEDRIALAGGLPPPSPGRPGMFRFATADEVCAAMTAAGLEGVTVHTYRGLATLPSSTQLVDFKRDVSPIIRDALGKLGPRELEHIYKDVAAQCEPFACDGVLRVPFCAWVIFGNAPTT